MKRLKYFFLTIFVLASFSIQALDVPSQPTDYITDKATLLSPEIKSQLISRLRQFEEETSNQVYVAIFPSLEGDSLEDFSIRLAEKWKIGEKVKDNGLIFLIFPNDKQMRIEVGYGLEEIMTDAESYRIISQVVAPYFKKEKFNEGVTFGLDAIMEQIKNPQFYFDNQTKRIRVSLEDIKKIKAAFRPFVLIVLISFVFMDLFRYKHYKKIKQTTGLACYSLEDTGYTFFEWMLRFSIFLLIIKLLFQMIMTLKSADTWKSNRGGSSRFSGGGGGGRFGGGGASGRW